MIVTETGLVGAFLLDLGRFEDERGSFSRVFAREELKARGLEANVAQCGVSYNRRKGTLRGLHYQVAPHAQAKTVYCTRGTVHDVIVDLRPGSPTYRSWVAVELSAATPRSLYVPAGFAHGFLTLEDDTQLLYLLSAPHHPASERGLRWDDPALGIRWPLTPAVFSARDAAFPLFDAGSGA